MVIAKLGSPAMTRFFSRALGVAVAQALLAHFCGELFQAVVRHFAPGVPPLACAVFGLLLGVIIVEAAVTCSKRMRSKT